MDENGYFHANIALESQLSGFMNGYARASRAPARRKDAQATSFVHDRLTRCHKNTKKWICQPQGHECGQ